MKNVLIVDDSITMLASLHGVLTKAGFNVEKAGNGPEALNKIKAGFNPDVVITDYHMPGMTGAELAGNLRALPNFRFKPILMLTTESQQSKREEAKAVGATGWLVKPVSPEDLVAVIKKVVPGA